MSNETRYTLAESARLLSITDMTVLYYIRYSKALPTRTDDAGNLYLLSEDIQQYRAQHQQEAFRRGKARSRSMRGAV